MWDCRYLKLIDELGCKKVSEGEAIAAVEGRAGRHFFPWFLDWVFRGNWVYDYEAFSLLRRRIQELNKI